jgi:hypothetical protein
MVSGATSRPSCCPLGNRIRGLSGGRQEYPHQRSESYRISVVTSQDRSIHDPCDFSRVTITICREILSASGDYWSLGGRSPFLPSTIPCCFHISRVHVRGLAATKPSHPFISRHKHNNQSQQLPIPSIDHSQSRIHRVAYHACRETQAAGRSRRDSRRRCSTAQTKGTY